MHRQWLLSQLDSHQPSDDHEATMRLRMIEFVRSHSDCFMRALAIGHITGSAWITNPSLDKILLTHHRKLDRWLQLGGHADGDPHVLQVALREAREESGVGDVRPLSESIFDIDIHEIPPHKNDPSHFHYDVRFLFEMDDRIPLIISNESKDLAWVELDRVKELTTEESITRMVKKTFLLQGKYA